MNTTAAVEPLRWSRRRWWLAVLLVFGAQVGLLWAIRDRKPIVPLEPRHSLTLRLRTEPIEWLGVNDPTLFVLPHRMGFSGAAWLESEPLKFQPEDSTEEPRFLNLPAEKLGVAFRNFVRHTVPVPFQTLVMPDPEGPVPRLPAIEPVALVSTLRIEGDLKGRRLLTPLVLSPSSNENLLTNSVVQVSVDARGYTFSATLLLPPNSNPNPDDLKALALAKSARFEPIGPVGSGRPPGAESQFTLGTMIFEWRPAAGPATNPARVPR